MEVKRTSLPPAGRKASHSITVDDVRHPHASRQEI